MTTRDTMLDIARDAILQRAARDGYTPKEYDPSVDEEGYVISILNALHHWCHEHGIDWEAELARAQELFEEDMAESDAHEPEKDSEP